ncbi:MAG: hypothetical protein ACLQJR_10970 [Stellaceae bacterium]
MAAAARLLTIEFLKWVASRPRTYAEVREGWRSTCPLTCAWEDAISDGLVEFEGGPAPARLVLSARGRAALEGAQAPPSP